MSLFDVIKYPLSDPPTLGELYALPEDLLMEEIKKVATHGYFMESTYEECVKDLAHEFRRTGRIARYQYGVIDKARLTKVLLDLP